MRLVKIYWIYFHLSMVATCSLRCKNHLFHLPLRENRLGHQNSMFPRYAYSVANGLVQALCIAFPPSPIVHNVVPWPWQHSKEVLQHSLGFLEWNDHGDHEHRTRETPAIDAKCIIIFRDIKYRRWCKSAFPTCKINSMSAHTYTTGQKTCCCHVYLVSVLAGCQWWPQHHYKLQKYSIFW